MPEPASPKLRFIDSMPRPLIVIFLAFAAAGIGLVVWVFVHPPSAKQVALELRRSPPGAGYSHNAVRIRPIAVPTPIPGFVFPTCVKGIVVEGGVAAQKRLDRALKPLCDLASKGETSAELTDSIHALAGARIRFALFTRTGDLSTTELAQRRIFLAIALSRANVPAGLIAPLLVHEGYHVLSGAPINAFQEFRARAVEYEACRELFPERDRWPRGCDDAQAMVRLGQDRAIELLVRAGYPR
jgi:hypothetical protein